MNELLNVLKVTAEEGFMYAVLALGVYLTYSILDFPDLSVDGTMPLGAIVTGVLIASGFDPRLCLPVAFFCGMAAGCVTGLLHVRLKIRPLLCGILVYTALLSGNLVILFKANEGRSLVSFFNAATLFDTFPGSLVPKASGLRVLAVSGVTAIVCKILIDLYLKTKNGLLLRATGDNERFTVMLGRNPGVSKIIGLALGNGFSALAGCIIAQAKGSADTQMGMGMVVLGLSSVIIGLSIFRNVRFLKPTTQVILGSLLYKACLSAALAMGLPTEYLKLLMAVLFTAALVFSRSVGNRPARHAAKDA